MTSSERKAKLRKMVEDIERTYGLSLTEAIKQLRREVTESG